MRRFPVGLGLCLILLGCARTRPPTDYTLTLTPPEEWTGGTLDPSDESLDWWVYFGDPDLDRAIGEALENSFDLQAAEARVRVAHADSIVAGSSLLPQVDLNLNRSQQRQNFIGFPIPGSDTDVLSTTSTNYGLRLNASWEPDVWQRVRSGEIAAVTNTRIRYADLAAARLSLAGQVARSWFAAVEAQRQVELAQVSLENFRFSADRVRERFQAGLRPSLDLRLALTDVAALEAALEQRIEQRDRSVRQLETLVGRYPSGGYLLRSDLLELPSGVPGGLPSELLHRRPDLVAAELQIVVADQRLIGAEAELRPRFSLTAGVGTASDTLINLVDRQLFVWSFVGGLVQPIFQGRRLRANVEANRSLLDEAVANYESRILTAYGEVESALAAEDVLARREAALEEAVVQSVAAEEQAQERYRLGLTDIITVLSSQRNAYNSESQLLAVRRARLDNRVSLHLALGGGFDVTDVPTLQEARDIETSAMDFGGSGN